MNRRLPFPALVVAVGGALLVGGCAPAGHTSEQAARRKQVESEALKIPAATIGRQIDTDDGSPAATISVRKTAFSPATLSITAGQALLWSFDDGGAAHSVTGDGFDSGSKTTGIFSHTFPRPGTFGYHCSIHPTMKGTVVVTGR